jgi:hypothetical protein
MSIENALLDDLYKLVGSGAVLMPIPRGQKFNPVREWQKTTFAQTQTPEYQAKLLARIRAGGNISVLLGASSGSVCTVDVDADDEIAFWLELNPALERSLRTRGARGAQIWMGVRGCYPEQIVHSKLKLNGSETSVAEWRGTGQSVIFGIHPETEKPYQRIVDEPVVLIDFSKLKFPPRWEMHFNGNGEDGAGQWSSGAR